MTSSATTRSSNIALVRQVYELSDELERKYAGPLTGQHLEIDYHIIWSGNEFVGDDGIFLHPNIPNWMVEQRGGVMAAQGDWPTIADRVSRALGTYASLRGRPSTGFLALLGGIEASTFQLPEKMNEINDLFFRLARSMDILVSDITTVFAGQAMFDEFHLRESAEVRRMFACRIARLTNLFFCDHRLRHFSLEQERLYPFITGGKYPTYVNLELYKHHLEKAVNIARHHYDAEEQVHENPWGVPAQDSVTQAREEEHRIAEAMSEIVIPDEVMQLEIESLVHLGGGRYATEEEARALRPTKVGAELLAKQSKGEMLKEIAGYRPSSVRQQLPQQQPQKEPAPSSSLSPRASLGGVPVLMLHGSSAGAWKTTMQSPSALALRTMRRQ